MSIVGQPHIAGYHTQQSVLTPIFLAALCLRIPRLSVPLCAASINFRAHAVSFQAAASWAFSLRKTTWVVTHA